MSEGNGGRRYKRIQMRRVYLIRRIVVACSCIAICAGVTLSTLGVLNTLRHSYGTQLAAAPSASVTASATPSPTSTPSSITPSETTSESTPEPTQQEDTKANQQEQEKQKQEAQIAALETPLTDQERTDLYNAAKQTAEQSGNLTTRMTYCIASRGDVGSTDGFANTVYRSLNNTQGWPRAGVVFAQGDESNCQITITLAAAAELPNFSSGCSVEYSCRVGNDVIINKTRWDNGVEHWLEAGGTLAQYRSMVINHEVGHALGHIDNETPCGGNGEPAPLMQEQSMFLNGCTINQWPLESELWSTFVGTEV